MTIFIPLAIAAIIVVVAGRIILGWVLPTPAMARVDRAFRSAGNLYLKLIVIAAAIGIVALIVTSLPPN